MHHGMAIAAMHSRESDQHPGMAIDAYLDHVIPIAASRDGDRCTGGGNYSMPGWRSMHPGMAIEASRDGDPCIRGLRSIHHGMASQHPWMAIDASLDGGHQSRVAIIASWDGDRCISGWHPRLAIDAPGMVIKASRLAIKDGDRCIPGW